MKKIIYFLVFLIIFIPNIVFADIYDVATSKAEMYILSNDYVNTYERYIISNSGELLSKNEFLLTLESEKNTPKANSYSYLYDGTKYWTSSKLNNKYYVVNSGETLYENTNDTPKTRVVETVKSDTIVSGSGNINNPWTFKYIYNVELSSNDLIKGRVSLFPCNNNIEEKSITLLSDSDKVAYLCAKPGYKYIDNTCDDILVKNNNVISIRKLSRDMNCVVNFGIDTLKITLENDEVDKEVNPNVLYLAYSKGWYLDNAGTKSIKKLVTLPEKTGYEYAGYYTEKNGLGTKVIDENGNILKGNEKLFSESSKIYSNFKAISYNISYNSNGGSGTMSPSTHIYNEEKPLTLNTFTRLGYSFEGWSTSSNGPIVYTNNQPVINLSATKNSTVTLFAVWKLAYSCPNGTLTYDETKGYICIIDNTQGSEPYNCNCQTCSNRYCDTCYSSYDCDCVTTGSYSCYCDNYPGGYSCIRCYNIQCSTCYSASECNCYTTTFDCNCGTCYKETHYCPSGWTNYSGSESTLKCYQAAKLN